MRLRKRPVLCNYYLTYRCNAKCGFCDIWEKPSPYANLQTIRENLIDLKKLGVKVVDFTGGEPLLHRDITSILGMAKEMGFITTLTTNCLLYPKHADELKGKVDMLHFSLDSAYEEKHNASRGVNCYSHFKDSLQIALSLGEKPDILFTVTNENIDEINEVYDKFCKPNNLVLILNPMFEYNGVGEQISHVALKSLKEYTTFPLVYLNEGFLSLRKDGGNHVESPVCKAATTTLVISPSNELVLPCYHLGKDHFPIEGRLYELYNSSAVNEVKKLEGRLPECEGCSINCYMQPSFAVNVNKYFWHALPSTMKYNRLKGTWKSLL